MYLGMVKFMNTQVVYGRGFLRAMCLLNNNVTNTWILNGSRLWAMYHRPSISKLNTILDLQG